MQSLSRKSRWPTSPAFLQSRSNIDHLATWGFFSGPIMSCRYPFETPRSGMPPPILSTHDPQSYRYRSSAPP
jgi:hypothetical protein